MKQKSYRRFFGKHFLIWLLIAAVFGALVTKMIRDPFVYDLNGRLMYQHNNVHDNVYRSLYEDADFTPKQAVSGFIPEYGADCAYLLYNNETKEIICDSSAIVKLQYVPYGDDYISPSVFETGQPEKPFQSFGLCFLDDPELISKVQPFRKRYYDFAVSAKDFYISKSDPEKVVLGEFYVYAYPPKFAGREYYAEYNTAPSDPENYIHYIEAYQYHGDRDNLPENVCLVEYLTLHTVGSLPGSEALETVRNAATGEGPDYTFSTKQFRSIDRFGDRNQYTLVYDLEKHWFSALLIPFLLIYLILLVLAAIFAALSARIGYVQYKKKYELEEYRRNLTTTLAHDLKTPLTAISGYAQNMRENVHPEKRESYTDGILENVQYMDRMIADVLDLAKLENEHRLETEKTDLMQLAHEALEKRTDQIAEKDITVRESGSCPAEGNVKMLAQAVTNLIDNAIRYTPAGGTVEITAGQGALCICNSTNLPAQTDPVSLAEPFAKGDSARGNQAGSGIGLTIVRQIADLHHFPLIIVNENGMFRVSICTGKNRGSLHRDTKQKK